MHVFPAGKKRKKNRGFTLVELVIVISILSVLLGILVPSLNSILGFKARRAANSITAALEKTKTEAMNRLVGEMKLSCESDGYYITYYLDHGKNGTTTEDSPEKIAPSNIRISYTTSKGISGVLTSGTTGTSSLIITYDRDTGAFRPLQSDVITQDEINDLRDSGSDVTFKDDNTLGYLTTITITNGSTTRTITLVPDTGTYTCKTTT